MLKDIDYIRTGVNTAGSWMMGYLERGEQMSMDARMEFAMRAIDDRFHTEHGYRPCQKMTKASDAIYQELIDRIMPQLKERLEALPMKVKKMMMTRAINQQTAESLITAYLKESGLEYSLEIQTHRAAVWVQLHKKKRARFYVYYKRMYDELEKLVPAVESLNDIIDSFSYFFKVY